MMVWTDQLKYKEAFDYKNNLKCTNFILSKYCILVMVAQQTKALAFCHELSQHQWICFLLAKFLFIIIILHLYSIYSKRKILRVLTNTLMLPTAASSILMKHHKGSFLIQCTSVTVSPSPFEKILCFQNRLRCKMAHSFAPFPKQIFLQISWFFWVHHLNTTAEPSQRAEFYMKFMKLQENCSLYSQSG